MKWISIQPLTGGMYLGTEKAIGQPAECILTFKNLSETRETAAGRKSSNEYHLFEYLKKHNRMPRCAFLKGNMFDDYRTADYSIPDGVSFDDIDVVVALPVCAGLSTASLCSDEGREIRNCNMKYLTNYALSVIKPKVYCFENAVALSTNRGLKTRKTLNDIAEKAGYNIMYYKTNTQLHDNCQHRCRTFVICVKKKLCENGLPIMQWEHISPTVDEYMSRMPHGLTQDDIYLGNVGVINLCVQYMHYKYGKNWRKCIKSTNIMREVFYNQDEREKFYEFVNNTGYDETLKKHIFHIVEHAVKKISMGKGWFAVTPSVPNAVSAVMWRSASLNLHYKEDRLYTIRELLFLMGMPNDFEILSDRNEDFKQIGQNVPVRTMQFIAEQLKRIAENDCERIDVSENDYLIFDNINQKIVQCEK